MKLHISTLVLSFVLVSSALAQEASVTPEVPRPPEIALPRPPIGHPMAKPPTDTESAEKERISKVDPKREFKLNMDKLGILMEERGAQEHLKDIQEQAKGIKQEILNQVSPEPTAK